MDNQIVAMRAKFDEELAGASDVQTLEAMRVTYLGKKGSITDLLKNMKDLSPEEKKSFGQDVNILKNEATEKIAAKMQQLKDEEIKKELEAMPEFDLSIPSDME